MRFKIDWASLIPERKFTVFAFFTLHLRAISKYKPPPRGGGGSLYLEGRFNGRFFALRVWGAYIWRGLYMEGLIFGILLYLCHAIVVSIAVLLCSASRLLPFILRSSYHYILLISTFSSYYLTKLSVC